MVGQDDLPEFPTPITVKDGFGRSKWTVSIPPTTRFPLSMSEYSDMCSMCREVAAHVKELHGRGPPSEQAQPGYYDEDPYFVDVSEAERRGLLPSTEGKAWKVTAQAQGGNLLGEDKTGLIDQETCKTSLTFVLESSDAGLGNTLMMLWMAYGLAKKEKRAFFIDDSRWAYGKYTNIFRAPPSAGCSPPPRHEMLPCPRQARHLVVSAATAHETFGSSFTAEYEKPRRNDVSRERPIFDLARAGYNDLFHLNDHDQAYVLSRIEELRAKAAAPEDAPGTLVGVHVRHGDLHPYEYQYNGAYIPLNIYADRAREILDENHGAADTDTDADANTDDASQQRQRSYVVLASDDPLVYESEEFADALRAQELIKLAIKQQKESGKPNPRMMHKFVEEASGWERGFFARMFWNLGRPSQNNADPSSIKPTAEKKKDQQGKNKQEADEQTQGPSDPSEVAARIEPSAEAMRLRGLIGRAYALDLAVLGQATDAVVCTVSAMACRLVAVIMGWDAAFDQGRWVNIDGDYSWTADLSIQ